MKFFIKTTIVLLLASFATACSDDTNRKAEALLQEAQKAADSSDFDGALSMIDSLRCTYPKAIEERKKALSLYQQTYKKKAEKAIMDAMAELDKANKEVEQLEAAVEGHKESGNATPGELSALTSLRLKRDSLQAKFDAGCATIRLIHKKIAEGKGRQ